MGLGSVLKKGLKAGLGALGSSSGVGVGASLLSGLFGARSEKKKEEAKRKANIEALNLKQTMGEDKRLGNFGAGQSLLGQLGSSGFTNIDPAAAAQLGARRTYDFSKTVPEAGAGAGSGLLSGLFGDIRDVASQYGANEQDATASPTTPGISAGQPIGGLGEGGGALTLDDLYKLQSSGTKDFR